jgi:hypothetical protein
MTGRTHLQVCAGRQPLASPDERNVLAATAAVQAYRLDVAFAGRRCIVLLCSAVSLRKTRSWRAGLR